MVGPLCAFPAGEAQVSRDGRVAAVLQQQLDDISMPGLARQDEGSIAVSGLRVDVVRIHEHGEPQPHLGDVARPRGAELAVASEPALVVAQQ